MTLCIDESAGTISDPRGRKCSMEEPGHQFKCRPGTSGPSEFGLEHDSEISNGLLTYDGGNASFIACSTGPSDTEGHMVYSSSKAATSNCLEIALLAVNQTSGCFAPKDQPVSAPAVMKTATKTTILDTTSTPNAKSQHIQGSSNTITSQVVANATSFSSSAIAKLISSSLANATTFAVSKSTLAPPSTSSTSTVASASCSVADSAPSIAPVQIGFPTQDGIADTSANASITPTNSTIFQYKIPGSFIPAVSKMCALQFRLPICSTLPAGYPCFDFSGSEQEMLSGSGMVFSLTDGAGTISWNNSALQQVYPGTTPVFGTFDCNGLPAGYGGDRKISWLASSVNQFSLSFLQAGVGSASQYKDGVGAWIVVCS